MAMAVNASGTVTTDGTSQSLATPSTSNVYVFDIDTTNLAAGDVIEVRVQKKVLTGGTIHTLWRATIGPSPRSEVVVSSPPVSAPFGVTVLVQRVAGADHAYDWSLMTLQ